MTSCQELLKSLKILPIQSQYILSLAMFVMGNQEEFTLIPIYTPMTLAENPTYTPLQHG
jgi:hypothetical protein